MPTKKKISTEALSLLEGVGYPMHIIDMNWKPSCIGKLDAFYTIHCCCDTTFDVDANLRRTQIYCPKCGTPASIGRLILRWRGIKISYAHLRRRGLLPR